MSTETQARPDESWHGVSRAEVLDYLLCLFWFGLLIGVTEALVLLAVCLEAGHFLFMSNDFLWMTPIAETAFHFVAGLPFLLLALAFPRRKFLFILVGVFGFFGTLAVLSASGKLAWWATGILSAGIALRAAWAVRKHPEGFIRIVRWSTPAFVVAVIVCAAVTCGRRAYLEHRALTQLPQAPTGAPNVLLVVLDTVRADALSNYCETGVDVPNITRFGEEGVLFERALSTCSWTLPSHASMFTGRYPHELSTDWDAVLDDRYPTLAEVLDRKGYATAGFVANLGYCGRATGLARGFTHYEDYGLSLQELASHCCWTSFLMLGGNGLARVGIYDGLPRKDGEGLVHDFANWLDHRPNRPFFAFINLFDAHDPYLPKKLVAENRELTHEEKLAMKFWRDQAPNEISDEYRRFARSCYNSKIHEIDGHIGRVLEELKRRGLRENTVVIVTADHGEQFGEHGVYYHGNALYEAAVHVPLMISWPGRIPTGMRIAQPVSLRDLAATILNFAGASKSEALPGHSLQRTWQATSAIADTQLSKPFCTVNPLPAPEKLPMHKYSPAAKGTMYSLLDGRNYVIREADDTVEFFDFPSTPDAVSYAADSDVLRQRRRQTVQELNQFLDAFPPLEESDPNQATTSRVAGASADSSDERQVAKGNATSKTDDREVTGSSL